MEVELHSFLTSAVREVNSQLGAPPALHPANNRASLWLEGQARPAASLGVVEKSHLPAVGFEPRSVHPVAQSLQ